MVNEKCVAQSPVK